MIEEIIVPKLGMAAAVVTLTSWKVKEGDRIEKGDTVVDLEAEKSTFEMPAPRSGFVRILLAEGIETEVSTVVGVIAETREEYAQVLKASGGGEAEVAETTASDAPRPITTTGRAPLARGPDGALIPSSPIARRLAAEHGIDLARLAGSGSKGRIQKEDVLKAIETKASAHAAASAPAVPSRADAAPPAPATGERRVAEIIPYRGMRKVIGENMMKSLAINAPNTMSGDFDFSEMVRYREQLVRKERVLGTRVTFADLVLWAVSRALKRFPFMNSSLVDTEIRVWKDINVGMAVALGDAGEKGLVVPVIHDAAGKSLVEISKAAKALGERARADKLMPEEMSGGTFTVSVFGSVGVSAYSTPIINVPEAGIIGIGRVSKKAIVRDDQIVIAPMLPYSLTHDHRIIDGAAAERFLTILKEIIEDPLGALAEG